MTTQKHLGTKALVGFIAFMNMFVPLSIDLYLPAMPEMGSHFQAGSLLVGMTLTAFFLMFALSIVFFGPLSDKYGRRKILISSTVLYIASSLICAAAPNVYVLIAGRILEAIGAGAIITVATALIKECFTGQSMTKILAVTQALGVIAPMAAPILGGVLLTFTSWRGAFVLLAGLGCVNLVLSCLLSETLPQNSRYQGKLLQSFSLLAGFVKYKRFFRMLIMFAMLAAPYMAYLAVSSFVYVSYFGLTAQEYSYYFAVNSAVAIIGPGLYLWLKKSFANRQIIIISFVTASISGLLVLLAGSMAAITFLPFTFYNNVCIYKHFTI
ncbi:MFS transporter [Selenomonas ruminantium]|uniref:MFS transporter n=1 Tax=Selenomonas ruminantium TaxID=971 RepID=UPI00040FA3EE|nr:MFS transporter [Selenomonas ruminantium]